MIELLKIQLSGRRPRLSAEVLQIPSDDEPDAGDVDGTCQAEYMRAVVRQATARVGEVIRVATEQSRRRRNGACLCAGRELAA